MEFPRAFHNSVVLPDGSVFVTGGMEYPHPFYDDHSVLAPELWSPVTKTFKTLNPMSVPRNYHSVAILLPDATVFSAGGGLCYNSAITPKDCKANHFDAEIFGPPYLFQADGSLATRPKIVSTSSTTLTVGNNLTITADGGVKEFSLIRYSSVTHSINTDQRRIYLEASPGASADAYTVTIPSSSGVALPGYWMLFALSPSGVPSVATTIQIVSK